MLLKKAIVSVTNDLSNDQRVNRICTTLNDMGFEVLLIGRQQKKSAPLQHRVYKCKRMNLFFEQGLLFYLAFNVCLFFKLLFTKTTLLYSNDLDTLLANYLASKIKRVPLVYDSHEIYCEVPELQHRKLKKQIWQWLEKLIIPKLKYCITVNQSIANYFENLYKVKFTVVRNVPMQHKQTVIPTREALNLPLDKKIVILQGTGINIDRGSEELVEAFQYLKNEPIVLLIIGKGDVIPHLKAQVKQLHLEEAVIFYNTLPADTLYQYTCNADLGISIDKNTNLNYQFSLPNKIFDYINAGIPVLTSKLPELQKTVDTYNIGTYIENHNPKHIAQQILAILKSSDYNLYKQNTKHAQAKNNWDIEKLKLIGLINQVQKLIN